MSVTAWMALLCATLVGFAVGVAVGQLGLSYRLARIEGALRNLANGAYEQKLFGHPQVPAEWVMDQVDTLVNREFR